MFTAVHTVIGRAMTKESVPRIRRRNEMPEYRTGRARVRPARPNGKRYFMFRLTAGKHRRREPGLLAASALMLTFLVPATASAATSQVAVTCYGGSVGISLPPNGYSGDYTTSSRCSDINLRIDSGGGQWVAVCWARHGTCQGSWTWVPEDVGYRVVATDVLDGTTFYFTTTGGGDTRGGRTAY